MTTENLSKREQDIYQVLATGKFYKEIGQEKNISINTVKKHIKNIYRKLGVHKRRVIEDEYRASIAKQNELIF